ncbi:MAG: SDR family oxidoreductase, partial [Eggerthellaceae bacterium]|nr:SDR family oxidoreductase [Eggerthellaceae bacterium]
WREKIMTGTSHESLVLVTGASSGIGKAVCELLLEDKRRVVGIDKQPATILSSFYRHYICDISDDAAVSALFEQTLREESIQYLVNCAGIFFYEERARVEKLNRLEWDATLSTNLNGAVNVTRHCLPLMRCECDMAIAFVSSDQVMHPRASNAAYAASKGGLEAFARACAVELRETGVRVNIIEAASVKTRFIERLTGGGSQMEAVYQRENERMPLGIIQPIDVAYAIAFLCSERARKITGQTLLIDSGLYS